MRDRYFIGRQLLDLKGEEKLTKLTQTQGKKEETEQAQQSLFPVYVFLSFLVKGLLLKDPSSSSSHEVTSCET